MAYDAVVSLIRTLKKLVQRKPRWISGEASTLVESLVDTVEYFQNILDNTSSQRRKDRGKIKELEMKITDAVNDIENVIELKVYEINELNGRLTDEMANQVLCETLSPLVEKIGVVKREVMGGSFGVTNEALGYGGDASPGHLSRQVADLNLENIVVGLEDDLVKIKRRLTGPPLSREIVPILGMGGMGKTTLAKKAYDDPEIWSRFDIRIWMTISQDYRIRDLLLDVAASCVAKPTSTINEKSDDELMDLIYKKLKRRRYLVVMDDIWSCDVWDLMARTFPDDNNGSRVILTSRVKNVATLADPDSPPHEMRFLNVDESWKLLHDNVFGTKHGCPPDLEDIGKQVAEKCQGLPLALLVVAGHLSKIARTRECWEDVARSVSEVVANESDKFLGVLAMSYNYLPNHLKPCFLYMGVFPEDREVNIQGLIDLWVSEGFLIRKESPQSLEEVGRKCWEDLVSRNLIIVRERRWNGEARTCGIHDLLRDLILREAEKGKFLTVTRIHEATNNPVRRCSFHSGIYQADFWESSSSHDLTRTMHVFRGFGTPYKQVPLLSRFKLIRVLVILHFTFQIFPDVITKLGHLRYLQFHCNDGDDIRISSMSELYNLQTLIFRRDGDEPLTIPWIWEMKHIRNLELSPECLVQEVKSGFMLENLEGLSCLCFSSCNPDMFSAIPNLKRLKIHATRKECEGENMPSRLNSLSCLNELEILKFSCDGIHHQRIMSRYALPMSLKRLTLRNTYLPWEDMANLVMLPNLEELKIKYLGFDGDVWRLNEDEIFERLKFLLIDTLELKHWEAGSVSFPNLQRLVVKSCYYLEEIPIDLGEIYTLESIELVDCRSSVANSVEGIQEEQKSMGNDCLRVVVDRLNF